MSAEHESTRTWLVAAPTVIGFAQGVALYGLYAAIDAKVWPATVPELFAPLALVATMIPLLVVAGIGNLRARTLVIWTVAATVLLVGLGIYDILRDPVAGEVVASGLPRNVPSASLWFAVLGFLFIAHSLIVSSDADRAFVASYPRYFEVAWKQGVQIALALVFVGAFWALLGLGTALFGLIKIEFPAELIKKPWFAIPATTLAIMYAVHVTDVRAGIVSGARTLLLTLLSWLLPLMALIACAFLVALLFTGLEPLWSTRRATAVLLLSAAALVFLINAVYHDGHSEHFVRVLRYAGNIAAIVLIPLIGIAAYGLALRVGQYGWTPDRIIACACVVVAASYALGYALAALASRPWMKRLEITNVVTAFVILGVLLALFSPVADPARISVADQVARLEAGAVSPDRFDFAFLRFHGGRFGLNALERLRNGPEGPDTPGIATRAQAALSWKTLSEAAQTAPRITPQLRAANIAVIFPKGTSLPESFLEQDWLAMPQQYRIPNCLTVTESTQCEVMMVDLDDDGSPEVIVLGVGLSAAAFKQTGNRWALLGAVANINCKGVREALREGKFKIATPELKELLAGGQSLSIERGCSGG